LITKILSPRITRVIAGPHGATLSPIKETFPVAGEEHFVRMLQSEKAYVPAAGHDWLLPLYDPLVKPLGGDTARKIFLDQATVRPGHRVLDIGCGTGTLAIFRGPEASGHGPLARYFHSSHRLKDNSEERILALMNRASFISCQKVMEASMFFGSLRIAYYQASAPMSDGRNLGDEPCLRAPI
jgi:hypothetical protein